MVAQYGALKYGTNMYSYDQAGMEFKIKFRVGWVDVSTILQI